VLDGAEVDASGADTERAREPLWLGALHGWWYGAVATGVQQPSRGVRQRLAFIQITETKSKQQQCSMLAVPQLHVCGESDIFCRRAWPRPWVGRRCGYDADYMWHCART
jgi:hypothetical protein